MIARYGKRVMSFILAMIMILSAVPFQALATEEEGHDHENDSIIVTPEEPVTQDPVDPAESEALVSMRAEITAYVEKLGITPDMPDVMLLYAYGNHESYEAAQASLTIQDDFTERAMQLLTKEEQQILYAEENTQLCLRYREVAENAYGIQTVANCTVDGIKFETTSTNSNVKASGTTVTATVKGNSGGCNGTDSANTMVLYITNNSGEAGAVNFDMQMTSVNSIVVGDANGKSTGESLSGLTKYSKGLAAGESFTIIITTAANTTENKLVMSNVSFVSASAGVTVTVQYSNAYGSVTSDKEAAEENTVDGVTTKVFNDVNAADGLTLTANSDSFLCWVDAENKIVSRAKNYTINPSAEATVKAVMTGGQACFMIGEYVYTSLPAAVEAAQNGSNKTIVLANNGKLPAGDYNIPSGITLLIPYNDGNTLCTTAPTIAESGTTAPSAYRTMTMATGAHITVNGAISLSATQTAGGGKSNPIGPTSFVKMESGSTITVNNGGKLYAWGYIQGSGAITVESGATVYECFQVMDWRGGDNTSGMIDNSYRVFPFSQYYVQNVEVPMTLKAGAVEKGHMAVAITLAGVQKAAVPFIGSDGMFNIDSGYIVKDYDESTGRLNIDVHGKLSIKSLSMSMQLSMIGSKTINSAAYVLPINGNMTVTMHSGGSITMTQDIALQPGARLIVEEGATCTLGNGNSIYVYDYDEWITSEDAATGEGPSFCGTGDTAYVNLSYPASVKNNVSSRAQDAYVEINGVADLSKGYVYTTKGGANIRGSGTIIMQPGKADAKTYQIKDLLDNGGDHKKDKWFDIPITSAKLTNADGTVVETANNKGVVTYKSVNGVWTCEHTYAEGTYVLTEAAATCLAAGLKTYTCNCGGDVKTETIAQLEHEYVPVVTDPTCTAAGYTTHTCKNGCNHSYQDTPVDALGHAEVSHEAQAPTCTEIGWDAYVTCSRCDYSTYVEKTALGHAEVSHEAKAPTCGEIGWDAYVTCSRCDYTTYVEKSSLGHDEVAHEAKAPTCTEIGWDAYVTCSRCDYSTYVEKTALGHAEVSHEAKAPTCTEIGWDAYVTCSRCDYTTYVEKSKLGHDYKAVVTAPTCTEDGYTTHTCSRCDDSYTDSEVTAPGHKWEWVTDKEATVLESGIKHEECSVCHEKRNENTEIPVLVCAHTGTMTGTEAKAETCTEDGNSAYWYCSACRKYYSDAAGQHEIQKNSWIISQKGHDKVSHEAKAPTCTEIGWDAYVTCSRCDYTTYVEKTSLGHDEVSHEAKAPTCTEIGWDAYVTCSRCDYSTYVEKTSLGHAEVSHEAKAPTCTEIGWDAYVTCSRCDYSTYAEKTALGHDEVSHEAKAPTCTEIGWDAYVTCSRCDYSTYAEKTSLGHDEVSHEAKAPTCTEIGWDAYVTCSRCDYTTRGEDLPIDPEGHVWDEGEPFGIHSCNSASYTKYQCTQCSEEKLVIVKEQHFRIPIAEEIPATCTQDGMSSGWKCEKCDEFWIPQEVIPALGHDWNGSIPCQSDVSACKRCDLHFDTKQEHLVVVDPAVPATCTEAGLTEGSHCGYCGEILVAQTVIPVAEHTWLVADMEIPATCTAPGHKEGARYCLICDYDADPIPVLEHEWIHRDAKKATYSAIGWNAHDYCLLCKTIKTLEQHESDPCEFCGENPEAYTEIPKIAIQRCKTLDEFLANIGYLEKMAEQYALEHPGTDPLGLVLNYLRTGVENYTSGSWAIMAGPEDKDFLKFVQEAEDAINANPNIQVWVNVSGLKDIGSYKSPSDEKNEYTGNPLFVISGHLFGTMDMTYHNKGSQNHADVGGWVGDLTDLLSTTDEFGVPSELTMEEKIAYVDQNYLFSNSVSGSAGSFGHSDLYADLDGYYFMNELITKGYKTGDLEKLMREYYQPGLTLEKRVAYLLTNRLDGLSTRQDLRTAVYNAYTSNKLISTLEGTRNFKASGNELTDLRKAVCYAFADEMCRIAGDYVEDLTNPRFTVFDSETKILAPGISQQINYATNADGKQIVYYVATADVNRDDVGLWVNYYDRDPGTPDAPVWKNSSVPNSAQNAQDRYGDPNSADYIENFNVIASTNAGGYSMQDDATPGGLVVMNGIEWFPQTNTAGFFAILNDGTAYMGTHDEYQSMMAAGKIQEAIGGFGEFVVQDGKVVGSATYSDAPRTSVGITSTGRVVIMCIDGRQAPFSSGASLQDVGYIMKEAGCVIAINLDGGGSTTFVARQPGSDDLTIMNRPSDGYPRNVSTNLLLYSTAPSSTKFDHAVIESEYDYATINTPVQMTAAGVSPSGNAVDLPEGTSWAVSDENWASITEDGVFTGKRLGEVTVYLMLDGKVVGSKLMTMTNPDQIYFEKAKVDAIYGSGVTLPLRARIGGKPIAINPSDVTITLSAPAAGTMDGFTFNAVESTVKTLTITASIGENKTASINVMLYKQGENSFDFDKATGGDRVLAWDRQVSNAKVEDGNIYNVIDPSKDMVTSYTFALDMTAIPIPERLEELTYMLPGGTMEGTNAWIFLTSLAQRISDLSYVKATVDFDDRFDVDYSNLKIINDYFTLTGAELDETTNTLTVTLNWIKQSQVIDVATANPLSMISGITLTPKAGVWEDVSKIDAVTSGTIGYEIYMRASGLYSFAQKPENQAVFGLYPYRNPADTSDAGGYFRDTYAEVSDAYTLVNAVKEGWVNEEGGFAYYVDGERLIGVQEVEGFYYDFGEEGVNVGQTPYTGLYFDADAEVYRYFKQGVISSGWQSINGEWYYFKSSTMAAATGTQRMMGVYYDFEENGKLVSGVWGNTLEGTRYYYGPSYHEKKWLEVDGEMYYFREGYRVEGIQRVTSLENNAIKKFYDFGDDGICRGTLDGLHTIDGELYYLIDGVSQMGLHKVDGDYYFFTWDGPAKCGVEYYAWETHCDLPCGTYTFGADGKMINGLAQMSDGLYYYVNGKLKYENTGLTKIGDDYYFVNSKGKCITGTYYCWATLCDLPCGEYEFGPDGKMLQGIVEKADGTYYYVNGKLKYENTGLTKIGDDYYFVNSKGKCVTGVYYAWVTLCDLPCSEYEFGADGKMLQGLVQKDDGLYYYVNGKLKYENTGLTKIGDDYYFVNSKGKCITGTYYCWATLCDLPCGEYEFGADGKMLRGIVEKPDGYYYYVNGKISSKYAGLTKVGDDYYFVNAKGKCVTGLYYTWATNCDLPCSEYEFGADGKMLQGLVQKDDGLYYYVNGKLDSKNAGLTKIGDDYYFVNAKGKCVTGSYDCWETNCDLPTGTYEFGSDGKMLHGLIQKEDGIYCYVYGKMGGNPGLIKLEDDYYFVNSKGKCVTGKYDCWKTLCDLPTGTYEFGPDGKMYDGFVTKSDGIYYYVNGKLGRVGLNYIDGYYYFVNSKGKLVTNQRFYVWETNGLLLELEYNFNELGQITG